MLALVLDDSRAMRTILRRILLDAGFDVLDAADGREGLALLDAGAVPDVALVDWNMPVLDGFEFLTALRANEEWRRVVVMMVTTESEHSSIVRALANGADEYVIKPFTAEAITEKLNLLGLLPV